MNLIWVMPAQGNGFALKQGDATLRGGVFDRLHRCKPNAPRPHPQPRPDSPTNGWRFTEVRLPAGRSRQHRWPRQSWLLSTDVLLMTVKDLSENSCKSLFMGRRRQCLRLPGKIFRI